MQKPFEQPAQVVAAWLESAGCLYATRTRVATGLRQPMSWTLAVRHTALNGSPVRLELPRNFPAEAAQLIVAKSLCLTLPHVEESGRVCLGVEPQAVDYDNPIGAVVRVIEAFDRFLGQCLDEGWVRREFQRERLAYWRRFCDSRANVRPVPSNTYVSISPFDQYARGSVALYFGKESHVRARLAVACVEGDPQAFAARHRLSAGTLVRGNALFVRIADLQDWTPAAWPRDLAHLDELIRDATGDQESVTGWLAVLDDKPARPCFVFIVQGRFLYGYQVFPPIVPGLTLSAVEPIEVTRIDAAWALTRDHQTETFAVRQGKRVLVLGCGALGSPVIELLARAGIGRLVLVDFEPFAPENCSRHILGLSATDTSKAVALAKRLTAEVPGADVKAQVASATSWVADCVQPGDFDLVVDCTGESRVRGLLSRLRTTSLASCPTIHAWLEPFGAAAHVVLITGSDQWPSEGLAESAVNVAAWPADSEVQLPACGTGFHPYGAADAYQAAGFTAERIIAVLDGQVAESTVWSWVRTKSFFDSLEVDVQPSRLVPREGSRFDSVMLTRLYRQVVCPNG